MKQLLLQLILIALNAFFAATEIAVISLNEKKVRALAEEGDKKARRMLRMIEEPTRFLSTIQIGITLAGFLGSAFAADNFADRVAGFFVRLFRVAPAHTGVIRTLSVILVTLILSYFTLVLGELVPKRVAMKHKEKLAGAVCGVITFLSRVLSPAIFLLSASTNGILRLFGINPHEKEEAVREEDIVLMLDAGADEGTIDRDDLTYIKNVFNLDRLTVREVMTPWKSAVTLPLDASERDILRVIEEEEFSRIPVLSDDERVLGILHARDYLVSHDKPGFSLAKILRPPVFVPETVPLDTLFKEMQTAHNHLVVAVSEYGETAGLVSMEDILEEIVGEIWDERDEEISEIKETEPGVFRVLATAPVQTVFDFFSLQEETEAATVNGWLTEMADRIPEVGFSFTRGDLTFTVTAADEVMTHELTVKKSSPPPAPGEN
ncbi:MAG: hemolysin family protein [Clostridia bacterium]|nr:hemolysin family protein [Clostridia bacterium]